MVYKVLLTLLILASLAGFANCIGALFGQEFDRFVVASSFLLNGFFYGVWAFSAYLGNKKEESE